MSHDQMEVGEHEQGEDEIGQCGVSCPEGSYEGNCGYPEEADAGKEAALRKEVENRVVRFSLRRRR